MLKIIDIKVKEFYGDVNYIVTFENHNSKKIAIAIPIERAIERSRNYIWSDKENPDPIYLNLVYRGGHYE